MSTANANLLDLVLDFDPSLCEGRLCASFEFVAEDSKDLLHLEVIGGGGVGAVRSYRREDSKEPWLLRVG